MAIDNCPPDLHRRLTSVCSAPSSLVSLITIEYDVREDQPEETDVFRLEPSSAELIERVIQCRFPHISAVGARVIATFSGGNARIAIALGKTIARGEDVSHLKDEELFARLFLQRNVPDSNLLKAAEVCSLVYSFDCQTGEGADIELKLLGSLIETSARDLYQHVSELKRRELIQQRGVWRAVLPHSIANRLAKRALENIPLDHILHIFENQASERFITSFSKRLSYLHESDAAREICRRWLAEEGLLGDVSILSSLGICLLQNIAPINPEEALSAIERVAHKKNAAEFFSRKNSHFVEITRLLRSLAYDMELFNRSVDLLCRFALSEKENENQDSIRGLIESLFYIELSGTHATVEQRLSTIVGLFESNQDEQIRLGISLLGASLQAWQFSSHFGFEFGARSRDYGYLPRSKDEVDHWFKIFIDCTVAIATSKGSFAAKTRDLLAEKFRELWINAGMYDDLTQAAINISEKSVWIEGWIAVKTTMRYDGKEMSSDMLSRLESLDRILVPTTLIERARLFALSRGDSLDLLDALEDEEEIAITDNRHTIEDVTRSLGREVGSNHEILVELLPEILRNDGSRLFYFGQGLADGSIRAEKMWELFKNQLLIIEESKRNYQVVRGFLNALFQLNTELCERLLNDALKEEFWAMVHPLLQASVEIDFQGIERLKQSIEIGEAPIEQYRYLAYGRVHEKINDRDLSELLILIASKDEGIAVSIEILRMRIHGLAGDEVSEILKAAGHELLSHYIFSRKNNTRHLDYGLAEIIKTCYADEAAKEQANTICTSLVEALVNHHISPRDYDDVLDALAGTQPIVFMDTFLNEEIIKITKRVFSHLSVSRDPMSRIDDELVFKWCDFKPEIRYPTVASVITPYRASKEEKSLEWTPLAKQIITHAPDPIVILNHYKQSFWPKIWSGSLADLLQSRLTLLIQLKSHQNHVVVKWAASEQIKFEEEIRSTREGEQRWESERNERFE